MITRLSMWRDVGHPDYIDVDLPFTTPLVKVVVVDHILDYEFLDVLKLMHGKDIKVQYLWDWHDELWDARHTKPVSISADEFFRGVASTRRDLHRLIDQAHTVEKIKYKHELFIRHRNDPPIQFIPPKGFFF